MALAGNKVNNHNSIEAKKKLVGLFLRKKKIMETELFGKKPYHCKKRMCSHRKKEHRKNIEKKREKKKKKLKEKRKIKWNINVQSAIVL